MCAFKQGWRAKILAQDQAVLRARLDTVEMVFEQGRYSEVIRQLDELLPICGAVLGMMDGATITARLTYVAALFESGEFADAARAAGSLADTLAAAHIRLEDDNAAGEFARLIQSMLALALSEQGRDSEAAEMYGSIIEIRSRLGIPADHELLKARSDLAATLSSAGRTTEAVEQCRLVLDAVPASADHDSLGVQAAARNTYSHALLQGKQYGEALVQARTATDLFTSVYGASNSNAMIPRINVATSLNGLGRHAEAEAEARAVAYTMARELGADHPYTCRARIALGSALRHLSRLDDADSELTFALESCSGRLGLDHPVTLLARVDIALVHMAQGMGDRELRDALTACQRVLGPDHPHTRRALENL